MSIQAVTLAAALLAVALAVLLQGALGWGVACGGVLGAAVAGSTAIALRRSARHAPEKSFNVFVVGFMTKLGVLMVVGLVYFAWEPLRDRLDPRGFLLTYVGAAVMVLAGGTAAARRALREAQNHTSSGA